MTQIVSYSSGDLQLQSDGMRSDSVMWPVFIYNPRDIADKLLRCFNNSVRNSLTVLEFFVEIVGGSWETLGNACQFFVNLGLNYNMVWSMNFISFTIFIGKKKSQNDSYDQDIIDLVEMLVILGVSYG